KVGAHPRPQRLGLADVKGLAVAILEQIDARLGGDSLELAGEVVVFRVGLEGQGRRGRRRDRVVLHQRVVARTETLGLRAAFGGRSDRRGFLADRSGLLCHRSDYSLRILTQLADSPARSAPQRRSASVLLQCWRNPAGAAINLLDPHPRLEE